MVFRDGRGSEFYLVKIGKCESKVNNGQEITASAALCYRLKEHKKNLGHAFDRELDIFGKITDLKHGGKKMACNRSTMTVNDVRRALREAPVKFNDFCCVIESTNEKRLKRLTSLKTFRIDDICDYAERFNWTEVRLMSKTAFDAARVEFLAGPVSLKKFDKILGGNPKVSKKTESMQYTLADGDDVISFAF